MSILPRIFGLTLLVLVLRAQDFDRVRAGEASAPPDSQVSLPPAALSPGMGRVSLREGFLAHMMPGLHDWLDAPLNSQVQPLDRVRTGKESRAEIQFQEHNVLRLAPATTLSLERLARAVS